MAHLYCAHGCGGLFRSLKSERPAPHLPPDPDASDGHLFITVIAYQLVQTIRRRLGEHGERASWASLRRILEGQQRIRQPSGARTAAPFMCANRRARSSDNGPSIRRSVQTPFPEPQEDDRLSPLRPGNAQCSAIRGIIALQRIDRTKDFKTDCSVKLALPGWSGDASTLACRVFDELPSPMRIRACRAVVPGTC